MKKLTYALTVCLAVCCLSHSSGFAEEEEKSFNYSLWLGGHYTEFSDYTKKVGEYRLNNDELYPETKFNAMFRSDGKLIILNSHYFDDQNINADLKAVAGERLNVELRYRSLTKQLGQDLLTNFDAKEATGGKIISHELKDPGADYNYNRHEILTKMDLLLSRRNNVRFIVAHRSILKNGEQQALSNNHCWGCHVVSQSADVDMRTHQVEAGLEATVNKVDVGYQFGYRKFESFAPEPTRYYDTASHPITYTNTGQQAEFGSRLIYDDTTISHNRFPETEKMTHKVRVKTRVGEGHFASALAYTTTENKGTELTSDALTGVASYSTLLSRRTRLIARVRGIRINNDDYFIDLSTYREGRPGPESSRPSFDFTRYSSLDRLEAQSTAEIITRLNDRFTLSVLGGYTLIDRDDYSVVDEGLTTKRLIGQAKLRYRKGLQYSARVNYRFEKTSDPFVSSKGLFEMSASENISRDWAGFGSTFAFFFYHEREALRYQTITTEPTDRHEFEWTSTYRPDPKVNLNLGLRGFYDKNGDLDSLDVEHFSLQPNLAVTLTPEPKWSLTGGYTFYHYKSRGPVTVALFDG